MKKTGSAKVSLLAPAAAGLLALALFCFWWWRGTNKPLIMRVPGTDQAPNGEAGTNVNPVLAGKLTHFDGQPSNLPGAWPQFRGPDRDGISKESTSLSRNWPSSGPRELWALDLGEGYAGAAVLNGRAYVMDYDRQAKQDTLRCLSLQDGREIWRFAYPAIVKRNHGMSRTVPAVTEKLVVAVGPKCHVVCLDANSGELRWGMDLVRQYGTTIPQWYAGQCPLIDAGQVILAPGGKSALLLAANEETGTIQWQTPNPHAWKMTHSSVVPMEFAGERMYVYCANSGVVGISARNGAILWETTDWKISIATVPTPLILEDGRIFLSGGYNAGCLMLQLKKNGEHFLAVPAFKLDSAVFGATQHTPIFFDNHIYGVRPDGKFACLDLQGKVAWASDASQQFGLGSFLMANGLIFALNDSGLLRLLEATPERYNVLAQAQVLKGRESWGPMALAGGRLIARDFTRMVCLDVAKP